MDNRIKTALEDWKKMEISMAEIFRHNTPKEKHFLHIKLDHYRALLKQYPAGRLNPSEKLTRRFLKGEKKLLNKQLYPNRLMRMAVSAVRIVGVLVKRLKNYQDSRRQKKQRRRRFQVNSRRSFLPAVIIQQPKVAKAVVVSQADQTQKNGVKTSAAKDLLQKRPTGKNVNGSKQHR